MPNEPSASARQLLDDHPEWYHSIELTPGVTTPGRRSSEDCNAQLAALRLPSLGGRSVLDVGAYDGFFSFAAERLGAERVVSLDHYVWSADMAGYMRAWRDSRRTHTDMPPPHLTKYWRPESLPGRGPFDAARAFLNSRVEPIADDFMKVDPSRLGTFDVVLFLGVLYHLEEPLSALRRLRQLTVPGGLAVIETEAVEFPFLRDRAACEFFPATELGRDASNWWAPNRAALSGMCRAAGFRTVRVLPAIRLPTFRRRIKNRLKELLSSASLGRVPRRYRLIVHASP